MEKRKCKACKKIKDIELFQLDRKYRRHTCKVCFYDKRKDYCKQWGRNRRRENVLKMLEYLSLHPCVDCGEDNPILLEFDHVVGTKRATVSCMVYTQRRWEQVEKEIKKCQVRCVRCHRLKTAKDRGWYKLLAPNRINGSTP